MSVKNEVLFLLRNKDWVDVSDFERLFPPGTQGHMSYGQRLRELRSEGHIIIKRLKLNSMHTFEYHLVTEEPPRSANEQSLADNFHKQEEDINTKWANRQRVFII